MPSRYKHKDGSWISDPRKTIHEWVKESGGKFGLLISLEIRTGATPEETALWASIRTTGAWEPQWFQVPDDVLFTIPELAHYMKPEDGSETTLMGGDVKQYRRVKTKSKFKIDRREYV